MKKLIVPLTLLLCAPAYTESIESIASPIDSKILKAVDGNARIIKMGEIISFQKKIRGILTRKMPTKKHPNCTFKSLVMYEDKLHPKERDAILHKFIGQFSQMMQHSVFDDLKLIQTEVNKIIEDWSIKRERIGTPLLIFKTKEYQADRQEGLLTHITTLAEFDMLLEDLHLFFDDLVCSLPKSYHLYQEHLHE